MVSWGSNVSDIAGELDSQIAAKVLPAPTIDSEGGVDAAMRFAAHLRLALAHVRARSEQEQIGRRDGRNDAPGRGHRQRRRRLELELVGLRGVTRAR